MDSSFRKVLDDLISVALKYVSFGREIGLLDEWHYLRGDDRSLFHEKGNKIKIYFADNSKDWAVEFWLDAFRFVEITGYANSITLPLKISKNELAMLEKNCFRFHKKLMSICAKPCDIPDDKTQKLESIFDEIRKLI